MAIGVLTTCAFGPATSPSVTATSASTAGGAPAVEQAQIDPSAEPRDAGEALPPVSLVIPAVDLETSVEPMGWRIVTANGTRTTRWDVPKAAAGWHVNSAGAGAAGNVVLSGYQAEGQAPFLPLALGEVETGHEIRLTDAADTVFVYRVTAVSEPIPATGATPAEQEQAVAYVLPTETAQLTLISGWPDFTTTHRVFVVAEFVGELE